MTSTFSASERMRRVHAVPSDPAAELRRAGRRFAVITSAGSAFLVTVGALWPHRRLPSGVAWTVADMIVMLLGLVALSALVGAADHVGDALRWNGGTRARRSPAPARAARWVRWLPVVSWALLAISGKGSGILLPYPDLPWWLTLGVQGSATVLAVLVVLRTADADLLEPRAPGNDGDPRSAGPVAAEGGRP